MIDVEILNTQVEIQEVIQFQVVKKQVATVIVNGEPQQVQEVECVQMICPKCGEVLNEFNTGVQLVEVCKAFGEMPDISNRVSHCPMCGTKLSYDKRIVSEQRGVFTNEESNS